jgi:hypothetical protein
MGGYGTVYFDALSVQSAAGSPMGGDGFETDLNSSWVEVYGTDHTFQGDLILTNGLLLASLRIGLSPTLYYWNSNGTPQAWQQFTQFQYVDNSGYGAGVDGFDLEFLSGLVAQVKIFSTTPVAGSTAQSVFWLRLQRAKRYLVVEVEPQTEAWTQAFNLDLIPIVQPKIVYNSGVVDDAALASISLAAQTDTGYAAYLPSAPTTNPYVFGVLHQSVPANQGRTSASTVYSGDTAGPAIGERRRYGIFCVPFASAQGLQAEAETGSLSAPWVSVADAAGSAGNAAKLPSGSAAQGNGVIYGVTALVLTPGTYRAVFRARTGTAGAGINNEFQLGVLDDLQTTFRVGPVYVTPAQALTTYKWFSAGNFAAPASGGARARHNNVLAAASVDWFADEAVFLPLTLNNGDGPEDIWREFIQDTTETAA